MLIFPSSYMPVYWPSPVFFSFTHLSVMSFKVSPCLWTAYTPSSCLGQSEILKSSQKQDVWIHLYCRSHIPNAPNLSCVMSAQEIQLWFQILPKFKINTLYLASYIINSHFGKKQAVSKGSRTVDREKFVYATPCLNSVASWLDPLSKSLSS